MDWASIYYLGTTVILFLLFAAIVGKTLRRNDKEKLEEPKYRMMDD